MNNNLNFKIKTMRKLYYLLISLIIVACSNEVDVEQKSKEAIRKYFTYELQSNNADNISIDTIRILSIDTVSEQSKQLHIYNIWSNEYDRRSKLRNIKMEKIKLQKELSLLANNYNPSDTSELHELRLDALKNHQIDDSIYNHAKTSDTINKKYLLVTYGVISTNMSSGKQEDEAQGAIILTKDFKVSQPSYQELRSL